MTWELAEAKARFEEVLETSLRNGPQVVTSGAGEFVVLSWEEWTKSQRRTAKEILLAPA